MASSGLVFQDSSNHRQPYSGPGRQPYSPGRAVSRIPGRAAKAQAERHGPGAQGAQRHSAALGWKNDIVRAGLPGQCRLGRCVWGHCGLDAHVRPACGSDCHCVAELEGGPAFARDTGPLDILPLLGSWEGRR